MINIEEENLRHYKVIYNLWFNGNKKDAAELIKDLVTLEIAEIMYISENQYKKFVILVLKGEFD